MNKFLFTFSMIMASAAGIACADTTKVRVELEQAKVAHKTCDEFKAIIEAAVARGDITIAEADQLIAEFCV